MEFLSQLTHSELMALWTAATLVGGYAVLYIIGVLTKPKDQRDLEGKLRDYERAMELKRQEVKNLQKHYLRVDGAREKGIESLARITADRDFWREKAKAAQK